MKRNGRDKKREIYTRMRERKKNREKKHITKTKIKKGKYSGTK